MLVNCLGKTLVGLLALAAMFGVAYGINAGFDKTHLAETAKSWLIWITVALCWCIIGCSTKIFCGLEWEGGASIDAGNVQIELREYTRILNSKVL